MMPRTDHEKYQALVIRTLDSAIFIQWISLLDSLLLIRWIVLTPFEQPGPGARSGKCYRRRGFRLTCLQDFFSIGGQFSFYKSFSCDGGGGGRGGGRGRGWEGDCHSSPVVSWMVQKNGPKVFFLKNTANSVLGQNSWRSSYADRRLANLTGLALNERTLHHSPK